LDPAINEVLYCIKVRTIKAESVFMAEMEEEQARMAELAERLTAEEPQVAEKVAGILGDYKSGQLDAEVKSDESGLQYIVHEMGTGEITGDGELAAVHYYGVLEDGTMFDNSWRAGRPYEFPVGRGQAIEGWDVALSILPTGTKATLIIPYPLAYGETGRPPMIPEKATLIFYIEIDEK
jgi:FKBP-type peptidyl-prolyl cis-trans isomerase